jgi:hypothetical protein
MPANIRKDLDVDQYQRRHGQAAPVASDFVVDGSLAVRRGDSQERQRECERNARISAGNGAQLCTVRLND